MEFKNNYLQTSVRVWRMAVGWFKRVPRGKVVAYRSIKGLHFRIGRFCVAWKLAELPEQAWVKIIL